MVLLLKKERRNGRRKRTWRKVGVSWLDWIWCGEALRVYSLWLWGCYITEKIIGGDREHKRQTVFPGSNFWGKPFELGMSLRLSYEY